MLRCVLPDSPLRDACDDGYGRRSREPRSFLGDRSPVEKTMGRAFSTHEKLLGVLPIRLENEQSIVKLRPAVSFLFVLRTALLRSCLRSLNRIIAPASARDRRQKQTRVGRSSTEKLQGNQCFLQPARTGCVEFHCVPPARRSECRLPDPKTKTQNSGRLSLFIARRETGRTITASSSLSPAADLGGERKGAFTGHSSGPDIKEEKE